MSSRGDGGLVAGMGRTVQWDLLPLLEQLAKERGLALPQALEPGLSAVR